MTTVYLDARFALDLAVNYCLLACAARLDGGAVRRRRLALAAGLGAGYGVLTLLPGLGALGHPVGAALAAAGMLLAAYGPSDRLLPAGGAVSGALLRLWGRAGFGVPGAGQLRRGRGPAGAKSGDAGDPDRGGFELRGPLPGPGAAVCQDPGRGWPVSPDPDEGGEDAPPAGPHRHGQHPAGPAHRGGGGRAGLRPGRGLGPGTGRRSGRRRFSARWSCWPALPGRSRTCACCPTRRWGCPAACCWRCGWTRPLGAGSADLGAWCALSPTPLSDGGGYHALVGGEHP